MAACVRPLVGILQTSRCARSAHTSSRWGHVIRGDKTLVAVTDAFYCGHHIEVNNDVVPIDWESTGEVRPDPSIADAWDYSHFDVDAVEANLADAATYRIIVLTFLGSSSNVKSLRAFRDNVTRKLAPTIAYARARAFAERTLLPARTVSNDKLHEISLIDGHAASWLKPHPIAAAVLSSPVDSEVQDTLEVVKPRNSLPLHWASGYQEVDLQRDNEGPAGSSSADLPIDEAANGVRESNVSNRVKRGSRRRRGTGRDLLADAGRHGYVGITAAGSEGSGRHPAT
ncbi:hypothetical protein Vafri_12799 [Volvox africanus]|uniref:Uncharacterized protein n=1 Tax=Volvox africanus TaxID=51714 RepID=A0A8J4BA79_9CHLO|nr:hypothetical protein Vafri_12799 [Volvox africanus]